MGRATKKMTPAVKSALDWIKGNLDTVAHLSRKELRDALKGFGVGRSEFRLAWKAHQGAKILTHLEIAKRQKNNVSHQAPLDLAKEPHV